MAGFQSPPPPPPPPNIDVAQPLPPRPINSDYYPYCFVGMVEYFPNRRLQGSLRFALGANTNGMDLIFNGMHALNASGVDWTFTYNFGGVQFKFYFVLVNGGQEIEFMDITSMPSGPPKPADHDRSLNAIGVQTKI